MRFKFNIYNDEKYILSIYQKNDYFVLNEYFEMFMNKLIIVKGFMSNQRYKDKIQINGYKHFIPEFISWLNSYWKNSIYVEINEEDEDFIDYVYNIKITDDIEWNYYKQ